MSATKQGASQSLSTMSRDQTVFFPTLSQIIPIRMNNNGSPPQV